MATWEYLIIELPAFEVATHAPGASAAVHALNAEGERGWEAVGMTRLLIRVAPYFSEDPIAVEAAQNMPPRGLLATG